MTVDGLGLEGKVEYGGWVVVSRLSSRRFYHRESRRNSDLRYTQTAKPRAGSWFKATPSVV